MASTKKVDFTFQISLGNVLEMEMCSDDWSTLPLGEGTHKALPYKVGKTNYLLILSTMPNGSVVSRLINVSQIFTDRPNKEVDHGRFCHDSGEGCVLEGSPSAVPEGA